MTQKTSVRSETANGSAREGVEYLDDVIALRMAGDTAGALQLLRERATPEAMAERWKAVKVAGELRLLGKLDEAEKIYQSALHAQPDHFHALLGQALIWRQRGERDKALHALLGLAQKFPDRPAAPIEAALDLDVAARHDEAVALLDEVLKKDPAHVLARFRRAVILDRQGNGSAARADVDAVLRIESKHGGALALKASLCEKAGDTVVALAALNAAVDTGSRDAGLWLRRARLKARLGGHELAYRDCAAIAKELPAHVEARIEAGRMAHQLGRCREALEWFQDAARLRPAGALELDCARELIHLEDFTAARSLLSRDALSRGEWEAVAQQLDLLVRQDVERARRWFAGALAKEERVDTLLPLMRHGLRWGFHDEAIQRLEQVLPKLTSGDAAAPRLLLARCHTQKGAFDRARAVLGGVDPTGWGADALLDLADLQFELGDVAKARQALEQLLALWQGSTPHAAQMERALSLADARGEPTLRDAFRETNGGRMTAQRMSCARSAVEEGHWAGAERLIGEQLAANPHFPGVRWRGRLALDGGHLETALPALDSLIHGKDPVSLQDLKLAIRALVDAEEIGKAWAVLEKFEGAFAPSDVLLEKARLLELDVQLDEEAECLQSALKRDPANERAALRLTQRLIEDGHLAGARALLDVFGARQPTEPAWLRRRLAWGLHAHGDWKAQRKLLDEVWKAATPRIQPYLLQERIEHLMLQHRHDEADAAVDEFLRIIPTLPASSVQHRLLQINCAQRLTFLGRHQEAGKLIEPLLGQRVSPRIRDVLHHAASTIEAFGTRDAVRYAQHRNALRNPRHHVQLTPFATPTAVPALRSAVLLHLFYPEMWPELRRYLANLAGTPHQIFVTVNRDAVPEDTLKDIRAFAPSATITAVENRGFDIGAHWQNLEAIDLKAFDLAVILQTKQNRHTRIGPVWRKNLLDALMATPERWLDNLAMFERRPEVGVIGSGFHRHTSDEWAYANMKTALEALGMPTRFDDVKRFYESVSGTMLMIRAGLLAEMHAKTRGKFAFEPYEALSLQRRVDRSLAHAVERALAMYPRWRGFETVWRP